MIRSFWNPMFVFDIFDFVYWNRCEWIAQQMLKSVSIWIYIYIHTYINQVEQYWTYTNSNGLMNNPSPIYHFLCVLSPAALRYLVWYCLFRQNGILFWSVFKCVEAKNQWRRTFLRFNQFLMPEILENSGILRGSEIIQYTVLVADFLASGVADPTARPGWTWGIWSNGPQESLGWETPRMNNEKWYCTIQSGFFCIF